MKKLILASASPYRRALLAQLGLLFETEKPDLDEEKAKDPRLSPRALAEHLALLKAQSLAGPGRVVIGGDQLLQHQNQSLGKTHSREKAIDQLMSFQGDTHELITAVCVVAEDGVYPFTDITRLKMKPLSRRQAARYVDLDEPWDCAGSYKIEKHGLMLFEEIDSRDFSAIQGLPLLGLSPILQKLGYSIP